MVAVPLRTSNRISKPVDREQRVTLREITWEGYQCILQALPQTRVARLIYDAGILEITMPLESHEQWCELIGLFIRILVVERGLKLKSMRSTTLDRADLSRGAEPDIAYYIQNQHLVTGKRVDLSQDPPPDLVVEVDVSHTDIDKNGLYASMGVPEFWRFNGELWTILQLDGDRYREVSHSPTFPGIEKENLYQFLAEAQLDEVAAEVAFRQWVRQQMLNRDR
jgi:Uma2 family endonuclease